MSDDICGNCSHSGAQHNLVVGCTQGWAHRDGIAVQDGCECNWAHVDLSDKTW